MAPSVLLYLYNEFVKPVVDEISSSQGSQAPPRPHAQNKAKSIPQPVGPSTPAFNQTSPAQPPKPTNGTANAAKKFCISPLLLVQAKPPPKNPEPVVDRSPPPAHSGDKTIQLDKKDIADWVTHTVSSIAKNLKMPKVGFDEVLAIIEKIVPQAEIQPVITFNKKTIELDGLLSPDVDIDQDAKVCLNGTLAKNEQGEMSYTFRKWLAMNGISASVNVIVPIGYNFNAIHFQDDEGEVELADPNCPDYDVTEAVLKTSAKALFPPGRVERQIPLKRLKNLISAQSTSEGSSKYTPLIKAALKEVDIQASIYPESEQLPLQCVCVPPQGELKVNIDAQKALKNVEEKKYKRLNFDGVNVASFTYANFPLAALPLPKGIDLGEGHADVEFTYDPKTKTTALKLKNLDTHVRLPKGLGIPSAKIKGGLTLTLKSPGENQTTANIEITPQDLAVEVPAIHFNGQNLGSFSGTLEGSMGATLDTKDWSLGQPTGSVKIKNLHVATAPDTKIRVKGSPVALGGSIEGEVEMTVRPNEPIKAAWDLSLDVNGHGVVESEWAIKAATNGAVRIARDNPDSPLRIVDAHVAVRDLAVATYPAASNQSKADLQAEVTGLISLDYTPDNPAETAKLNWDLEGSAENSGKVKVKVNNFNFRGKTKFALVEGRLTPKIEDLDIALATDVELSQGSRNLISAKQFWTTIQGLGSEKFDDGTIQEEARVSVGVDSLETLGKDTELVVHPIDLISRRQADNHHLIAADGQWSARIKEAGEDKALSQVPFADVGTDFRLTVENMKNVEGTLTVDRPQHIGPVTLDTGSLTIKVSGEIPPLPGSEEVPPLRSERGNLLDSVVIKTDEPYVIRLGDRTLARFIRINGRWYAADSPEKGGKPNRLKLGGSAKGIWFRTNTRERAQGGWHTSYAVALPRIKGKDMTFGTKITGHFSVDDLSQLTEDRHIVLRGGKLKTTMKRAGKKETVLRARYGASVSLRGERVYFRFLKNTDVTLGPIQFGNKTWKGHFPIKKGTVVFNTKTGAIGGIKVGTHSAQASVIIDGQEYPLVSDLQAGGDRFLVSGKRIRCGGEKGCYVDAQTTLDPLIPKLNRDAKVARRIAIFADSLPLSLKSYVDKFLKPYLDRIEKNVGKERKGEN